MGMSDHLYAQVGYDLNGGEWMEEWDDGAYRLVWVPNETVAEEPEEVEA